MKTKKYLSILIIVGSLTSGMSYAMKNADEATASSYVSERDLIAALAVKVETLEKSSDVIASTRETELLQELASLLRGVVDSKFASLVLVGVMVSSMYYSNYGKDLYNYFWNGLRSMYGAGADALKLPINRIGKIIALVRSGDERANLLKYAKNNKIKFTAELAVWVLAIETVYHVLAAPENSCPLNNSWLGKADAFMLGKAMASTTSLINGVSVISNKISKKAPMPSEVVNGDSEVS